MNTQKGFAPILLILLAVVVVGGGVYFYLNQQSKVLVVNQVENIVATTSDSSLNNQTTSLKQNKPIVTLKANGNERFVSIQSGQTVNISWTTENATNCSINSDPNDSNLAGSWSDKLKTNGSLPLIPTSNTTYTVTCYSAGVSGSASININVNSAQNIIPHITSAIVDSNSDGYFIRIVGTGFTASSIVNVSGNSQNLILPATLRSDGMITYGTELDVPLPDNMLLKNPQYGTVIGLQYTIYVSNGVNSISNTVDTASQG